MSPRRVIDIVLLFLDFLVPRDCGFNTFNWEQSFAQLLVQLVNRRKVRCLWVWRCNETPIEIPYRFRTDRPGQTLQTQIRLLLEEQSDQGLHCLPFRLHRLDSLLYGRATYFKF